MVKIDDAISVAKLLFGSGKCVVKEIEKVNKKFGGEIAEIIKEMKGKEVNRYKITDLDFGHIFPPYDEKEFDETIKSYKKKIHNYTKKLDKEGLVIQYWIVDFDKKISYSRIYSGVRPIKAMKRIIKKYNKEKKKNGIVTGAKLDEIIYQSANWYTKKERMHIFDFKNSHVEEKEDGWKHILITSFFL